LTTAVTDVFRCPTCSSDIDVVDEDAVVRCRVCGLSLQAVDGVLDLVPEARRGAERAFYDEFYERAPVRPAPNSLAALGRTWTDPMAPWEMQRVWNRLGDLCDRTVLLLGNGESDAELYLLTKQPRVMIYSDLSPVGLREIRRRVDPARHGNVLFAAIDALDLPLRDESVDLVYGFAFAHHLPDIEMFLNEVARILRPGGRCVFMDNAYSAIWQHVKLIWLRPLMWFSHHREPRSPEDVRETMSGGFREERLAEVIREVGGEPRFERVAFLYYLWKRVSVSLFPDVFRIVPRHDLVSAALMRADRMLARVKWTRSSMIRLIWGFEKSPSTRNASVEAVNGTR
jgi:SAM-dependent methyltransferase